MKNTVSYNNRLLHYNNKQTKDRLKSLNFYLDSVMREDAANGIRRGCIEWRETAKKRRLEFL